MSVVVVGMLWLGGLPGWAHAEAMLQYFNTSWVEITRKMPELAEAGYTSLWLPPPTKGSGGLSVGYDLWDPFDLGSIDQRGSVRTRYGTEAELLELMRTAHRFGIRVYFDNIMNHRAFDVPGYNESTPITIYPGMVPEDFHLRLTEDGFYRKWDNTRDWGSAWQVQNLGLADLIDIAHENPNTNFGRNEGDTHPKYSFVRHPDNPEFYDRLPDDSWVGFGKSNGITKEILAANPGYYSEDVNAYLIRAVRWLMDRTKADGLRLDAVKHVPDYFFGKQSGVDKNSSSDGYLGGVQWQFNMSRGFSDWDNHRDSVFEDKLSRDDALVFGEHLGQPPGYSGYWDAGMRLVDNDLRSKLNGVLGNPWATLAGLDQSGAGGFSPSLGVMHANSHDSDYSAMRQLQHAIYYTREGIGLVYTDGYYQAETLGESGGAFPRHANTAFLGQFADPRIPNLLQIHQNFARGLQNGLWADTDYLAYERRDNRNPDGSTRAGSAADEVTMVIMLNDNSASGQARPITTSFPPGAYLYQYATGPNGSNQVGFYKFASELGSVVVPPGGYFVFSYRTPELSSLWPESAVTFYQDGVEVDTITVTRKDGPDGDQNFNPYGFSNRGYAAGETPKDYTYRMKVPVVKGGIPMTILARSDGSAENILLKLDGGIDLNGTGLGTDSGKRDNPPALRTDTWLGYEQPSYVDRQHPELFAAKVTGTRDITGSPGAETFTTNGVLNQGSGTRTTGADTALFIYHDPTAPVDGESFNQWDGSKLWAKVNSVGTGYRMFVYYTTDDTYYPEGAGGIGKGRTKVIEMGYQAAQSSPGTWDWWASATMPGDFIPGTSRYKIGVFKTGAPSWWPADAASVAYKKQMLTTFQVSNWNPATIQYHRHNDYNSLTTGLDEGFHVIRAKALLNRDPWAKAALYNTFTQTFYYDAQTPEGEVAFPQSNGDTVGGSSYEIVVRTDPTVEEVWFNFSDSEASNNDSVTRQNNGNGDGFEPFTDANQNGVRDANEPFTDLNGNGVYDDAVTISWAAATEVTANPSVSSNYPKEWRIRYTNIPASGTATITFRLLEASSSRDLTQSPTSGHTTELVRTVNTAGPLERINIAWPQNDGDTVDDNYILKVYFSKALAAGTTTETLLQRFNFLANSLSQSRDGWSIDYGDFGPGGAWHELSIPLPNLYNDLPDYLHELEIQYRFPAPDNRVLDAYRLVRASPSTKPFVMIVQPSEIGSDGRPVEIVIPDLPGTDQLDYTVRVNTSASVSNLVLTGSPAITLLEETYVDANGNGRFDDEEPYEDANNNGQWDAGEAFTDVNGNTTWDANERPSLVDSNGNGAWDGTTVTTSGNTKVWDFRWNITSPGVYLLTASTGGANPVIASRTARVVLRELVNTDTDEYNDDDNDGLIDYDEMTLKELPEGNAETWTNGDVHVHFAYGRSLPNSPDSDGDGLPDGLEVGWRTATNPPTDPAADTNGDGFPNFIGDLDPPLYAVVENHGYVPGVGSQSQGDNRTRQAAGSVTDPTNPDTDGDGLPDGVEDANRNGWTDGDGKALPTNAGRAAYATYRPNDGDWPNDIMDSFEIWTETSPTNPDSDGDGLLDGYGEDKNLNGIVDPGETDPLNPDTDGDGLPDGWEVQHGLDPLDPTGDNGSDGDPDGDGFTNSEELAAGTHPTQPTVVGGGGGEGAITIGKFTDWRPSDLLALDEYNEGGSQGADVYRTNIYDSSRDIVAFSFRDGGAVADQGTGLLYFRIDFLDLTAYAEQGEVDAYIVIDTGNPAVGERALPDSVNIATDMRWEVVIGAYATNSGSVSVDTNRSVNTITEGQNPYDASFGVVRRGLAANGLHSIAWDSGYDAVEIAVHRQALIDAGWLGDPATLNFQVFTTRDGTADNPQGPGDIGGRNDIRDTVTDDWLASDYWKDQDNIRLNGKLTGYVGRSSANDRGRVASVMLLAHGNQAMQPGSEIQPLVFNGVSGYKSLLDTHEAYGAPLTLHVTATLASALQWAESATPGAAHDGPSLNARIANLVASGQVALTGSTFSDHALKYFPLDFNSSNVDLAEYCLDAIYGNGTPTASRDIIWTPERILDDETLTQIAAMNFGATFADQSRHFVKWFGRTSALSTDGFRINEVNGVKLFPIHDTTSVYLDSTLDNGSTRAVRELLSRRARSNVQDQVVVLWRDLSDFSTASKAASYDTNVRWLASRPWVRLVTAQDILNGSVPYVGQDGQTHTTWGTVQRGTGLNLVQTAKDWIDHATQENYDNWFFGSSFEEGLSPRLFGATTPFGQVAVSGHADTVWQGLSGLNPGNAATLGEATLHAAMFQSAFHNTTNSNLAKFSTGAYIYPDTDSGQTLASFARVAQSQTRTSGMYVRVAAWAASPPAIATATSEDVDLDGENEYLLANTEVFAVFEARGGRMVAGFARNTSTGAIYQMVGAQPGFAGADNEEEGTSNALSGKVNAYRTSAFKDWFANGAGGGTSQYVNAIYTVTPSGSNGWTFTAPGGHIVKKITLADDAPRFDAQYTLSGDVNKLYVRAGLSPDLASLMVRGQQDLTFYHDVSAGRLELHNPYREPLATVFAYTPASASAVLTAIDDDPANNADWDTVPMRNQIFTQQVEVENLSGHTAFGLSLIMQTATTDTDHDSLPDWWEDANALDKFDDGTTDPNNGAQGDPDNDTLSNDIEYLVGTKPQLSDAHLFPRASIAAVSSNAYSVVFPTLAGRIYRVWYSDDLVTWHPAGSAFQATEDNPASMWSDDGSQTEPDPANAPHRFYRITITRP